MIIMFTKCLLLRLFWLIFLLWSYFNTQKLLSFIRFQQFSSVLFIYASRPSTKCFIRNTGTGSDGRSSHLRHCPHAFKWPPRFQQTLSNDILLCSRICGVSALLHFSSTQTEDLKSICLMSVYWNRAITTVQITEKNFKLWKCGGNSWKII